ncbi:MAG: hisD [Verrucomicrobiales bacterium]|nr:hisD [Verrucomicrobiales bacterium]
MKLIRYSDPDFDSELIGLAGESSLFDQGIEERTWSIIQEVLNKRDEALIQYTHQFNGFETTPDRLKVNRAELLTASLKATPGLRKSVKEAWQNIRLFANKGLRKPWSTRNSHGASVGEKFDPLSRVGIYVPGGTAPLVSTALMTITLAKVAGCKEIVVCTPCAKDGSINSSLLYAVQAAGATEIYRLGGAQAIAAMALGTPTVRKVQKVFGPGNSYVVAAKRLLFGHVGIDLLPGPSEVLVLADAGANPEYVAADLVAQAEHGSGHERVWLVTDSKPLIKTVENCIKRNIELRDRKQAIKASLDNNGAIILVRNLKQAVAVANQLAPEHCELLVKNPRSLISSITTSGAIFVGQYSPTVVGDYVAGPSHTLPTGGAGHAFSGLTVDQFQRRTSVVEYSRANLKKALHAVQDFAQMEGLDGHGASATIRFGKTAGTKLTKTKRDRS